MKRKARFLCHLPHSRCSCIHPSVFLILQLWVPPSYSILFVGSYRTRFLSPYSLPPFWKNLHICPSSMDKIWSRDLLCARVFSRPAAILKAEKTLGTRLRSADLFWSINCTCANSWHCPFATCPTRVPLNSRNNTNHSFSFLGNVDKYTAMVLFIVWCSKGLRCSTRRSKTNEVSSLC